jgi:hypothetical protein
MGTSLFPVRNHNNRSWAKIVIAREGDAIDVYFRIRKSKGENCLELRYLFNSKEKPKSKGQKVESLESESWTYEI